MEMEIKTLGKFRYVEEGEGEPLILLHGLFGALSNFKDLFNHFKANYRVIIPMLPLFDLGLDTGVGALAKYVQKFIETREFDKVHLMGNSLGGHVGLIYTLHNQEKVKTLILTGSSGLFENGMGETYPKRGDYEFIRKKTELTFYDPAVATKELVDEVYAIVNNRLKAIKIIALAKSAIRNNLSDELREIKVPTCLIWGKNDTITPPMVAEEFKQLLPNSELFWVDKCGHAPMMEVPETFCTILAGFLDRHKA
ncbi:alpha/beta fold hydrolase [Taibaiella chishuiensis]|uniref:Pimeloyl-ACP methyl ester carboxylesterase n=1 Tax=Taibaiella chishuiensis TaxID=1434707 RepID=A0A2P8D1N5_9BACT|nr:alpha/beta hydrolase [Taibaiella chishuiensis]PSK91076.1 pimeloyl-ACP methyl ester carboxylesterase [Taibaiella chishuiensis]